MGIRWEGDLEIGLRQLKPKVKEGIIAAANYTAPVAQTYMRTNAKWTDRTGAARNGLNAKVDVKGDTIAIILYHTVPYGIWLEVRWGGRYAIIKPGMAYAGPIWMYAIRRLVFDGGKAA